MAFQPEDKYDLQIAIIAYMNGDDTKGAPNTWDVSQVTDMSSLFLDNVTFNEDISNWDVSNVTDMRNMFTNCQNFNQPLNNWNVSNVTNMENMFEGCTEFDQPLNNWNVSSVTNTSSMFKNCSAFNQPLNNWNMTSVTDFADMFAGCTQLNQSFQTWALRVNPRRGPPNQQFSQMFRNTLVSADRYPHVANNQAAANAEPPVAPTTPAPAPAPVAPPEPPLSPLAAQISTILSSRRDALTLYLNIINLIPQKTLEMSNVTLPPDATGFDVMEGDEVTVSAYLAQNPRNVVLVLKNQYFLANKDTIRRLMQDGSVFKFPCKSVYHVLMVSPNLVVPDKPIFTLRSIGLYEGFLLYSELKELVSNPNIRAVELVEQERVPSSASLQMLTPQSNALSAAHCQEGQDGMVYEMRQIPVTMSGGRGRRRRTRTRKRVSRRRRQRTRRRVGERRRQTRRRCNRRQSHRRRR